LPNRSHLKARPVSHASKSLKHPALNISTFTMQTLRAKNIVTMADIAITFATSTTAQTYLENLSENTYLTKNGAAPHGLGSAG
jgi:hypothetical protein